MVIVSKSQKTKLPFSLPLTSRQVQAAEPQADPFRSATCEHQMYVNQSHSVTPAGHACILLKTSLWTSRKPFTFWVFIFAFLVIVIQTREYNTHTENSNNRQDVCIDKFTNHFET